MTSAPNSEQVPTLPSGSVVLGWTVLHFMLAFSVAVLGLYWNTASVRLAFFGTYFGWYVGWGFLWIVAHLLIALNFAAMVFRSQMLPFFMFPPPKEINAVERSRWQSLHLIFSPASAIWGSALSSGFFTWFVAMRQESLIGQDQLVAAHFFVGMFIGAVSGALIPIIPILLYCCLRVISPRKQKR